MCAAQTRGWVLLIDHAKLPGEKFVSPSLALQFYQSAQGIGNFCRKTDIFANLRWATKARGISSEYCCARLRLSRENLWQAVLSWIGETDQSDTAPQLRSCRSRVAAALQSDRSTQDRARLRRNAGTDQPNHQCRCAAFVSRHGLQVNPKMCAGDLACELAKKLKSQLP